MGLLQRLASKKSKIKDRLVGRVAVYDSPASFPRLITVGAPNHGELMDKLTEAAYKESHRKKTGPPFVVLREVIENLIHADFSEVVVSIFGDGSSVRISDQGPGIEDKGKAFEIGFTTANAQAKRYIRGVGSGLPVVKEIMGFSGGSIEIKDNINSGTVITLSLAAQKKAERAGPALSTRQMAVLSLVTELGLAGPSDVNKELDLSLSTAHREFVCLEEMGLLKSDGQGKRACTSSGLACLNKSVLKTEEFS